MRQRFAIRSFATRDNRPLQARERTRRWVVTGLLALSLLSVSFASLAQDDRRPPRADDWGTDNLDMVAASPEEIRAILVKDPGLMVELKRLMAVQATEKGQIVSERDMTDDAVVDRLETDTRFRALATRMLQRYGYLTPEVNPASAQGREQYLLLKARADRLASLPSGETGPGTGAEPGDEGCVPGSDNQGCQLEASKSRKGAPTGTDTSLAPCDPNLRDMPCPSPADNATPSPVTRPRAPSTLPPDMQHPDMMGPTLMTVSASSPGDQRKGSAQSGTAQSGELMDVSGGIPPVLPDNPLTPPVGPPASPGHPRAGAAAEPVEMISSASPYAYLPSLRDLYMQAAPSTGHLQRFGLAVFRSGAGNQGIPMDLPAGPDYVLGPGDGLTIDLWGGVSGRIFRSVDREGRLSLPEVGPLQVSGKTLGQVQQAVQHELRTQYRDVSADISLARIHSIRIYVVGEVVSPGAYDISSLSTPLNALFAAGGITPRGSLRHLKHFRGNQLIEEVNAYDLLLHGVRGDLKNLENGDTLLVPPVGPQVSVDGMVRRPAIYELRGETNLEQVLDLAGGVLPAAALRHIEVQRLVAHEKRTMLSVNLDETSDPQAVRRELASFNVQDGDEIHIFPIASYNTAAVYLQGHVLRPGKYAYTPGMRLTDLVGSYHDLLPEPAEHYAEIVRLSPPDWRPVVESVDLAQALANPQASPKLEPLDTVRIFGRYDVDNQPVFWLTGEVRRPGEYRTSGQMHLRDAVYEGGGLLPDAALDSAQLYRMQPDGSLKILNVNLAAVLNADPLENVLVQPRDRILVHRDEYREDPPSVYIRGQVLNPGRYPLAEDMRVSDLLLAAGGPKRSADLTDGDLTRYFPVSGGPQRGEHRRVDLTEVFHEASLNLPLKDGDVLTVPELPGWKDLGASITVKGEVKNPGVYGIRPGERLSSVLRRAGGLLPTAFPQGAIFTRVSVRELQEQTRQDLINRMEQEGATVKTSLSTTGSEQAQLAAEAGQQQQRVLEALRRAPATGRMVVRMRPGLKGFENSSQDIEVRDGDTIDIPKQPGVVLIVGQVYNSNAITYVAGRNARWYLSESGGATKLANKKAIFIIRADGEITSRTQGGWWSDDVLASVIRPGDTIVVPERALLGDTRWKSMIALAQIAEAGAITAALVF